jgi:hypothetical protein
MSAARLKHMSLDLNSAHVCIRMSGVRQEVQVALVGLQLQVRHGPILIGDVEAHDVSSSSHAHTPLTHRGVKCSV